jgi:hypothetical protein
MCGMLVKPVVAFCHQNPVRLTLEAYFPNKIYMIAYFTKIYIYIKFTESK